MLRRWQRKLQKSDTLPASPGGAAASIDDGIERLMRRHRIRALAGRRFRP